MGSRSMNLKYNTILISKWQEVDLKNIRYRQRAAKTFKEIEFGESWDITIKRKTKQKQPEVLLKDSVGGLRSNAQGEKFTQLAGCKDKRTERGSFSISD